MRGRKERRGRRECKGGGEGGEERGGGERGEREGGGEGEEGRKREVGEGESSRGSGEGERGGVVEETGKWGEVSAMSTYLENIIE